MNIYRYKTYYYITYALSLLPLRVLYFISDVVYVVLYRMIGYRKKLVRRQLEEAFPEKTEKELREIERKFYHWFCDYFVETIKMLSATDEYMMKMLEYRGMDKVEEVLRSGQSVATMLGHFGNWELLSCTKLAIPGFQDWTLGLIYHALRNRDFDRLFLDIRSAHHGTCIDKHDILRELVKLKKDGRVSLFGYILDQSPKWDSIHLWLPFLNHDTPVFTGAERIARKFQNAVFYIDMQRPKRGKYIFDFQLVTLAPQDMEENELTRETFRLLDASIRRQPECYLWTHNRWKRTHEEYNQKVASGELRG